MKARKERVKTNEQQKPSKRLRHNGSEMSHLMMKNFAEGFMEDECDMVGLMRDKALEVVKTFKTIKKAIW